MSSITITKTAPTTSASVDRGAAYVRVRPVGPLGLAANGEANGTRMPNVEWGFGVVLCPGTDGHAVTSVARDAFLPHLPSAVSGRGEPMI
ncbi:MAG: hypothetical protein IPK37_14150 [Austwickia sp.]|jgi:hypothetical protein|nr:MAG: hypothetical protein IPK37_14150 [Austwickia sp.]